MRILGNRSGVQGVQFDVQWDLDSGLVEEEGTVDPGEETFGYDDIG